MARRMILMLVLMAVFVGTLGFIKVRQFQAMARRRLPPTMSPTARDTPGSNSPRAA